MDYYRSAPEDPSLLTATVLGSVLLALAFFIAWLWVEWRPSAWKVALGRCGFLLVLLYPLESVREYWNTEGQRNDLGTNIALLSIEAVLAAGVVMTLTGNLRVVRAARRISLTLTLLFPSLLLDFTWSRMTAEPAAAFEPRTPAKPVVSRAAGRRVVWLLFDELDQRLVFDLKEPKVDLPELDRLRSESFVATQAEQTAGWTTLAVPSLLSGRIFERAELMDASTLAVLPEGEKSAVSWRDEPNVFKRARTEGFNSALVGWHHPYCRVLGDELVKCVEVPSGETTAALLRETSASEMGALRTLPFLFRLQRVNLEDMFRSGRPTTAAERDEYSQARQQQQYFQIRDATYAAAADRGIDLLFAHFPAPHFFGIYNSRRRDFTLTPTLSYVDNLALVDRTVRELRCVLERAGLWDSTTVILTSDHGLRPDLWRGHLGWTEELDRLTGGVQTPLVPCIIKPAGKHQGIVYERPFSTVVEGDLVLGALRGELATPEAMAAWLDRHAANP